MIDSIKKQISFNRYQLKFIALISMVIDHIAAVLILMSNLNTYFTDNRVLIAYDFARALGRIAFPIFAFFIVEGFLKTHNKLKYFLRMLIFAMLSQIPYNLAFGNTIFYTRRFLPAFLFGNIMWSFLLAIAMMYAMEFVSQKLKSNILKIGVNVIIMVLIAYLGNLMSVDRGGWGILTIGLFYLCRQKYLYQAISGLFTLLPQQPILSYASLILLYFYNGRKGKSCKYFFYIFYPVHLLVLYFIRLLFIG